MTQEHDTLVIGGGAVGMAIAYGLCCAGERVALLDEGDSAFRASRGNFGLVWVQGKGLGHPAYARWSMEAARAWPAFAAELKERSGVEVDLAQPGGLFLALDDDELARRASILGRLRQEVDGDYAFEVLDGAQTRRLVPQAGPEVAGAVLCPMDGHVSPLKLLRALFQAYERQGGTTATGACVERIERLMHGGFRVHAGGRAFVAAKLVLAAGLGNARLAPMVGLRAPVTPLRGQILVTERLQPFLRHPTTQIRQTGEGVVQIGDSKEDVGLDDATTLQELARIAARAIRCFPLLAAVNVVRAWGALRVMTSDGLPLYEASRECPGAFLVTCHSGITLAPQHAGALARWIHGGTAPAAIRDFSSGRFDVPTH